jgi:twitching motility protein PilT
VFATLHTANAAQSIDRIVDVFPPYQQQQVRIQLAQVLEAVISQQLIANERVRSKGAGAAATRTAARRAGGTATLQTAWPTLEEIGRVPAVEIMIATPAIRNLIREAKTHQIESTLQTGAQYGMQTMDMALADLYRRRLISYEDAIGRAIHPDDLKKLIAE